MTSKLPPPPEWLKHIKVDPSAFFELSDREAAIGVLPNLDYEAQLQAIHKMLRMCNAESTELSAEIAKIKDFADSTSDLRSEHAVHEWTDRLYESVYQDAAHSMAAVGMLGPFVESMFFQAFQGVKFRFYDNGESLGPHVRWTRPGKKQWDCHFVTNSNNGYEKNLANGILELADATNLTQYLPKDLHQTLQALFHYRNKMFHHGFEWPVVERQDFKKKIQDENWPNDWFDDSKWSGEIWIYYVTDTFIQHCVAAIEASLEAFGAYCNQKYS